MRITSLKKVDFTWFQKVLPEELEIVLDLKTSPSGD